MILLEEKFYQEHKDPEHTFSDIQKKHLKVFLIEQVSGQEGNKMEFKGLLIHKETKLFIYDHIKGRMAHVVKDQE